MSSAIKISEAAALGIHTLAYLFAFKEKKSTTREIAAVLNSSEFHLAKVLQRLSKVGFIRALRGPHGGFEAVEEFEDSSLLEIVETIDGPIRWNHCIFERKRCADGNCLMKGFVSSIDDMVIRHLRETTVKDLAAECRSIYNSADG